MATETSIAREKSSKITQSLNGVAGTATGISVEESGIGLVRQTVITLSSVAMTIDEISDTDAGWGTVLLYTFPAGAIGILGSSGTLTPTLTSVVDDTLNASVALKYGIGTVAMSASITGGTPLTTGLDILPFTSQTAGSCNIAATANTAGTAGSVASHTSTIFPRFNGTSTAITAYLNIGVAAGDIDADATVTLSGTFAITWINFGDY